MENMVIAVVLLAIVGAAIAYVVRAKKKGRKCIGCPYSDSCPSRKANAPCHGGCDNASSDE